MTAVIDEQTARQMDGHIRRFGGRFGRGVFLETFICAFGRANITGVNVSRVISRMRLEVNRVRCTPDAAGEYDTDFNGDGRVVHAEIGGKAEAVLTALSRQWDCERENTLALCIGAMCGR